MTDADRAVAMLLQDNAAIFSEVVQLRAENAKLRELVRDMQHAIGCLVVLGDAYVERHEDELCAFDDRMRELGVEP